VTDCGRLQSALVIAFQQLGRQLYQTVGVISGRQALGSVDGAQGLIAGGFAGHVQGAGGFYDVQHLLQHADVAGFNGLLDGGSLLDVAALHGGDQG